MHLSDLKSKKSVVAILLVPELFLWLGWLGGFVSALFASDHCKKQSVYFTLIGVIYDTVGVFITFNCRVINNS